MHNYDFFILARLDMFANDNFIEMINPYDEKIRFPFVLHYNIRKLSFREPDVDPNIPTVCDYLMFYPKKYIHLLNAFEFSIYSYLDELI